LNNTEERKRNYFVNESRESESRFRSTVNEKSTPNDLTSSYDESKDNESYSRNSEHKKRGMMNTVNLKKKYPEIAYEAESNAVINAKIEIKNELKKLNNLKSDGEKLDEDILDLKDQINEVEKQKLKYKLQNKGSKTKKKKNNSKKSTETQYLRTDLNEKGNTNKIKKNVDRSLAVENNANAWLKQNERLVSKLLFMFSSLLIL